MSPYNSSPMNSKEMLHSLLSRTENELLVQIFKPLEESNKALELLLSKASVKIGLEGNFVDFDVFSDKFLLKLDQLKQEKEKMDVFCKNLEESLDNLSKWRDGLEETVKYVGSQCGLEIDGSSLTDETLERFRTHVTSRLKKSAKWELFQAVDATDDATSFLLNYRKFRVNSDSIPVQLMKESEKLPPYPRDSSPVKLSGSHDSRDEDCIVLDACHDPEPIDACHDPGPLDACHNPEPKDTGHDLEPMDAYHDPEQIDACPNSEPIDACPNSEPIDACHNPELIDACPDPEPIDASEKEPNANDDPSIYESSSDVPNPILLRRQRNQKFTARFLESFSFSETVRRKRKTLPDPEALDTPLENDNKKTRVSNPSHFNFPCQEVDCVKRFKRLSSLKAHIYQKHGKDDIQRFNDFLFGCGFCGGLFMTSGSLKVHKRRKKKNGTCDKPDHTVFTVYQQPLSTPEEPTLFSSLGLVPKAGDNVEEPVNEISGGDSDSEGDLSVPSSEDDSVQRSVETIDDLKLRISTSSTLHEDLEGRVGANQDTYPISRLSAQESIGFPARPESAEARNKQDLQSTTNDIRCDYDSDEIDVIVIDE